VKKLTSTRVVIPMSLLILVAFTLSLEYFSNTRLNHDQIITNRTLSLQNTLNYLQSSSELFLASKSASNVQQTISSFAAERDISTLIVSNNAGEIIASTDYTNIGRHWNQIKQAPSAAIANKIAEQRRPLVQVSDDSNMLTGITQICDNSASGLNRVSSCGMLFIAVDLNYLTAQSSQTILNSIFVSSLGTALAAFAILIILSLMVTNPAHKIVQSVNRFKNGDHKTRIKIRGSDELTTLGDSINELFSMIEAEKKELREKQTRYSSLIDTMADGVITLNANGIIEATNPSADKLLGYTNGGLLGTQITQLSPFLNPDKTREYAKYFAYQADTPASNSGREVQVKCESGNVKSIRLSVSEIDVDGIKSTIGVFSDISELKSMEAELKKLNKHLLRSNKSLERTAVTDSLTGLYNRRQFDMTLLGEVQRATRQSTPLSLLVIDIDYFKQYNDYYGHAAGDECLIKVAGCLRSQFQRSSDLTARYGGEEFGIILGGSDETDLAAKTESLRLAVLNLQIAHEKSEVADYVTVSIGALSYLPQQNQILPPQPKALFTQADQALYQAKSLGRNQSVIIQYRQHPALANIPTNWTSRPDLEH